MVPTCSRVLLKCRLSDSSEASMISRHPYLSHTCAWANSQTGGFILQHRMTGKQTVQLHMLVWTPNVLSFATEQQGKMQPRVIELKQSGAHQLPPD